MDTSHVTPTGIAVALAVALVLGLFFFGSSLFPAAESGTASQEALSTNLATTTMNESTDLPTELTGSDVVLGSGTAATKGSTVTVNYVGMLPDGTVFDASERHGQPFVFTLGAGQVISGWDIGIEGMQVGGKRRLIIPPQYGYGAQGAGGVIPPNATLIFDVELLSVQ